MTQVDWIAGKTYEERRRSKAPLPERPVEPRAPGRGPAGRPRRADRVENLSPRGGNRGRGRARDARPEAKHEWHADERESPARGDERATADKGSVRHRR